MYKWINLYGKTQGSGVSKDELRQLKRENAKLMEQNEILKKSYRHLHEQVETGGNKRLIQDLRKEFSLSQMTETLDISRSN